uniref:Integrase catalytic domain-containing protein n=1 Tax=Sinocyclocheilus grahami TaxID=75366 RepID=A0A672M759_SINGR
GRPRLDISVDQLNFLLSLNFTARQAGDILGVSYSTIKNRQFSISLKGQYSRISNAQLDEQIRELVGVNYELGPEAVRARLYAEGFVIQRRRVRASMQRIDPEEAAYRAMTHRFQRRVYHVAGPNSLWHIDGNHKLIRWRVVVHGGIDGFRRLVVFLQASNNNRSATVMDQFVNATVQYGVPSRVRCDHGGENNAVCLFMEVCRGSAMRGRSTHNQKIERLWGDVWRGTINVYHSLFTLLEQDGMIDPINEKHMWAVHYNIFVNQWNHHRLRTARCMSPYQIFVRGCLALQHRDLTGIHGIFHDEQDRPEVVVPHNHFTVSEEHRQQLQQQIDPLSGARDSLGIDVLQELLSFLAVDYP